MYKKAIGITVTFLLLAITTMAQEVMPKGGFQVDSVKIGVPIPFTMSAKYPRNLSLIFPDSLYDFSPFEFESKDYYTTKSDSTQSLDSVVYYLSTFEIDSILYLSLPIFEIKGKDTLRYFTPQDSVILIQLIEQIPDSIKLKENTAYLNVPTVFNYPYFLIGLGVFIIILIAIVLIFGKKIKKAWQIRKLNRKFKKFSEKFEFATNAVRSKATIEGLENVVYFWKRYLEKLEKTPYTKMTTKEIKSLYEENENDIIQELMMVDKWIYGGVKSEKLNYDVLKDFAEKRKSLKIEEVKNG